jgi:hypothetical protein
MTWCGSRSRGSAHILDGSLLLWLSLCVGYIYNNAVDNQILVNTSGIDSFFEYRLPILSKCCRNHRVRIDLVDSLHCSNLDWEV